MRARKPRFFAENNPQVKGQSDREGIDPKGDGPKHQSPATQDQNHSDIQGLREKRYRPTTTRFRGGAHGASVPFPLT